MGFQTNEIQPHAVCIPYPAQGHVTPMLKLAKVLHSKGFHITFVNSDFNHKRLLKARGPDFLKASPTFQFHSIPDGLPPSDDDITQDIAALCDSTSKHCIGPFRHLLENLSKSPVPPVTCIVSDAGMCFTVEVAKELDIPCVYYWTPSFSFIGFTAYLHFPALIEKGYIPLKDETYLTNGYLEQPIEWIPGMRDVRLRDLPTFFRTTDINDIMVNTIVQIVKVGYKASAHIFNTFDALEQEALEAIKSQMQLPPIYTVGPLPLLLSTQTDPEGELKSLGGSLWKEESECLKWLDTKEPNSVLYINFGSITVITPQQMVEFAWGLANSKHNFLWVIRPDLVTGDSATLPPEFITETAERSRMVSWCPQEEVLNHASVGGFLTHNGWNSTLESISSGVPMICWPFFAEHQTNCSYLCVHWGIGVEIDNNVKREDVENIVREFMDGEKGKRMKLKALEWKNKAQEAVAPGGSSYSNMDELVNQVLLSKINNQ